MKASEEHDDVIESVWDEGGRPLMIAREGHVTQHVRARVLWIKSRASLSLPPASL